jgi:hypothetical protein
MKKFAIMAVIAILAVGANAQTTIGDTTVNNTGAAMPALGSNGNGSSQQQQQASSNANAGVTGSNNFTIEASEVPTDTTNRQVISGGTNSTVHQSFGSQKIKNTPSVNGAPLVSSNDTCMGSASGSVNGPGFGIGLGKTYTDDNCVMLKNSRELWNMGMKAAAMALMCTDSRNREALEITGFECPQTTARRERAASTTGSAAAVARQEPTDPIVRKRMGLPSIAE